MRTASSCSPYRHAIALGAVAVLLSPSTARADPPQTDAVVQVIAPHRDVGETTVRREDTRDMPGTFGDPTRFAETLPGVVPSASGLQALFVRGAPPTATGTFIDGVPVPALYHVGFGPSVVHPGLLDHVDFYQGAPPAGYGRYVGGVLAATTSTPADFPHAEANLRLFDVGALAEMPLADGRGSALVAARYGYPGVILPLFASGTTLSYWDYQARATWNVDDRNRIGVFVFGSNDQLNQLEENAAGTSSFWQQVVADEFHRVDLRWDRVIGSASTMRMAATAGRDQVGDDAANGIDDIARLRMEIDSRASSTLRIRAGADAQFDSLRPGPAPEGAQSAEPAVVLSRDAVVVGAHADAAWKLSRFVELTPGLRADVYSTLLHPSASAALPPGSVGGSATPVLEPRLAARARITPGVSVVSTVGASHQLPGLVSQYPDATPSLQPGLTTGLQSSVQASQGLEMAIPGHFMLSTTGFLHEYFGLPDLTACAYSIEPQNQCVTPTSNAKAFGLEVLLRRPLTERLAVWVSYTLSRSVRQARPPGSDEPTMTILSEYDRTHVLSAVVSYDLGRGWRAGGRFFAYSGRPYTGLSLGRPVEPFDSQRLPGFFRIDARLEKAWSFRNGRERIALVIEGVNVTLNKEVVSATCGESPSSPTTVQARGQPLSACSFDVLGPITIPSIGLEGTFR